MGSYLKGKDLFGREQSLSFASQPFKKPEIKMAELLPLKLNPYIIM